MPRHNSAYCVVIVCVVILLACVLLGCSSQIREQRFVDLCKAGTTRDVEKALTAHPDLVNVNVGETPLHYAVMSGNQGTIKVLIKHGAKVNAVADSSLTPLLMAVITGRVAIARQLIAAGADVNKPDDTHTMPLHFALVKKNYEMVKLLVESGADVNAPSTADGGGTPLSLARHDRKITAYLKQHGAWKL